MKKRRFLSGQMSDSFLVAALVAFSGGFQDAYTYTCRGEVFANAQTGNIVLMSSAVFDGDTKTVLKYIVPVLSFVFGTVIAEVVHIKFGGYTHFHWRQTVLACEIIILLAVGFLPNRLDRLANALVSFVCALQVQAFHKVKKHVYASTMCIGNLRSGTEAFCEFFHTGSRSALGRALVYFGVIAVFALGAASGNYMSVLLGTRAVWVCSAFLFAALCIMIVPEYAEEKKT